MLIPSYIKIDQATSKYIEDFEYQLDVLISKIQQHQDYSHLNCEMSCTLAESPDDKLPYRNTYNADFSTYGSQGFKNIIEEFFEERKESLGDNLDTVPKTCVSSKVLIFVVK